MTVSATTKTARASPSQPPTTAVWPLRLGVAAGRVERLGRGGSNERGAAGDTWRPSTTPSTPRPSRFVKSSTAPSSRGRGRDRAGDRVLGEVLERADEAQRLVVASSAITSTSVILPLVTVPVLSSTTVSTRRVDSSTSGPLISRPSWAPRPVPTISATGVARPSAHGQAMISTATAAVNANVALSPVPSQKPSVATVSAITIGTNTPATRSASRWTGALPVCAAVTSRAIWASAVSAPTLVARTTSRPPALTVAPATSAPGPTSTGTDSPVSRLMSTAERPSSTTPSVATFSPGRTRKSSPTVSCSTAIVRPSSSVTSLAPSSSSAFSAAPARRLARASK